jgi:hypothetical protein
MAGLKKPAINAIRSVAFLLDKLEDTQINLTVKEALENQMMEFTYDMKTLVDDAKEKIDTHVKAVDERLSNVATPALSPSQAGTPAFSNMYASVLVNSPAYANPRIAAREGIKARQFAFGGIKNSKFSHLDNLQLKTEINKILKICYHELA